MNDEHKHQLIEELAALRQRVADLESAEAERQRLEETLRESQERLSKLMTIAPVGIFLTDPQGRCTFVNQRWREMVGLSLEQTINESWMAWLHPDDQEKVAAAWDKMIESEGKWSLEYRYQTPEGQVTWVLGYATALHDRWGRLTGYIGANIDITERKQAELKLQEAERRFRTLLDDVRLVAVGLDQDGRIAYANPYFLELTGYTSGEILSRDWFQTFIPERNRPVVGTVFQEILSNGIHPHYDNPILTRSGEERLIAWNNTLLYDLEGKPVGTMSIGEDVTERRQAEEELLESQERYRSTIDALNSIIHVIDQDLRLVLFNRAMQDIIKQIGISEDLIGKNIFEAFAFLPDKVRREYKQVLETGQALTTEEATQVGQHKRWTETRKIPVRDPTGRVFRVITIIHDITEHKRIEEQLQQYAADLQRSNRELEQFAYVASHDLQEPLRMVNNYLHLLEQEHGDQLSAEANEFIRYATDGASRMQEMIKALLAYSRVGAGDRALEPVDCESILGETLLDLHIAIEESGAVVTHDPLPTVMADGAQLSQVFQNLIENAIKFQSEKPPWVHIWAEELEDEWLFAVRDNGIGIEPQQRERIFDIFQRLHTQTEYPGTGMGLATCKKIVERHDGRIWVESELGQGSTFYFTIPRG